MSSGAGQPASGTCSELQANTVQPGITMNPSLLEECLVRRDMSLRSCADEDWTASVQQKEQFGRENVFDPAVQDRTEYDMLLQFSGSLFSVVR